MVVLKLARVVIMERFSMNSGVLIIINSKFS